MPVKIKNRFLLLYGSQTGQAKAIAEEIGDQSEEQGLHADIFCLSLTEKRFNIEREACVVFVISTTGEGDPPDTAAKFVRRLRKKTLPDNYLSSLNFTVLGLGDTNYTNFCNCGKDLNKRILELGGQHLYDPGWADDAVGLELVVEPWIDSLWKALKRQLRNSKDSSVIPTIKSATQNQNLSCLSQTNMDINKTNGTVGKTFADDNENVSGITENVNVSALIDNKNNSATETTEPVNSIHRTSEKTDTNKDINRSSSETSSHSFINNTEAPESSLTVSTSELSNCVLTLPSEPPPFIHVQFEEEQHIDVGLLPRQNGCPFPSAASEVKLVSVLSAVVLTATDAVKNALKITLDIENCGISYEPGDSISVVSPNNDLEVSNLLDRLGVIDKADCLVNLSIIPDTKKRRAAIPPHIPEQSTLRHIFNTCIDIREPPKKALLRVFVECTINPCEKRRLEELCSKQGSGDYSQFIREQSLSIMDILVAFPSCLPSITCILEHTSRLKPRPYSACSAPSTNVNRLEFVFNIVEIPAGNGRHVARRGVCTGWLDDLTKSIQSDDIADCLSSLSLNHNIQIPVFARSNQHFRPPTDLSSSVMFIGPGTGVAPFIGFLSDRENQRQSAKEEKYGDTWLFYGCRNKDKDFIFQEELHNFKSSGTLHHLCVSFSRDMKPEPSPKYVQDYIIQEMDAVYEVIEEDKSLIYVCGDAKNMAKNVNEAFVRILKTKKGMTDDDAKAHLMKMRLHRRYFEDVWT